MRVIHRITKAASDAKEWTNLLDFYGVPYTVNYGSDFLHKSNEQERHHGPCSLLFSVLLLVICV